MDISRSLKQLCRIFNSVENLQLEPVSDIAIIVRCILAICVTQYLWSNKRKNMLGILREMSSFKALQRLPLLSDMLPPAPRYEQVEKWYILLLLLQ